MPDDRARNLMTIVAARVVDLRAEFEAQLRAVARLERQLRRSRAGTDEGGGLEAALRRELAEMRANNHNIRGVLNELATEAGD